MAPVRSDRQEIQPKLLYRAEITHNWPANNPVATFYLKRNDSDQSLWEAEKSSHTLDILESCEKNSLIAEIMTCILNVCVIIYYSKVMAITRNMSLRLSFPIKYDL